MPVKGSMAAGVKRVREDLGEFLAEQARSASTMTRDHVKELAPVGKRVNPDTGQDLGESGELKRSVEKLAPRRVDDGPDVRWRGGAIAKSDHASYVNDGTRAHIIEAKTGHALRFWWTRRGTTILSKVHHPGFAGTHFADRGLLAAQREFEPKAEEDMQGYLDERMR